MGSTKPVFGGSSRNFNAMSAAEAIFMARAELKVIQELHKKKREIQQFKITQYVLH